MLDIVWVKFLSVFRINFGESSVRRRRVNVNCFIFGSCLVFIIWFYVIDKIFIIDIFFFFFIFDIY